MASEHVAVATARAVITRLKIPCAVLDVKTDALNLLVAAKHLPKVQQAIEAVRHCDLARLAQKAGQKTPGPARALPQAENRAGLSLSGRRLAPEGHVSDAPASRLATGGVL